METLTFTTPTHRTRSTDPIEVTWCGDTFTLTRPKDWVIWSAQNCLSDQITDSDRAMSILKFLLGTLGQQGYARFLRRALDNEINLTDTISLIARLLETWGDYQPDATVTIDASDDGTTGEPIRIVNDDLGIDAVFHPPNDLVITVVAATLTAGEDGGAHQWAIEVFLDGTLARSDALLIKRRLRLADAGDDLDVEGLAPIMTTLLERWEPAPQPAMNRAQRRSSKKKTRAGGSPSA